MKVPGGYAGSMCGDVVAYFQLLFSCKCEEYSSAGAS